MSEKITRNDFFRKSAVYTTGVGVAATGTGFILPRKRGLKDDKLKPGRHPMTLWTWKPSVLMLMMIIVLKEKVAAYAAFNAMVNLLRAQLPATFPSFPNEIMVYGHGGVAGWGTICGAINGAAALISLVCDKATSDQLD